MDTKNAFGLRPTTLRAAEPLPEPLSGPLPERTVTLGYGHGWSLAKDRVLRGRSTRPGQSGCAARSIG